MATRENVANQVLSLGLQSWGQTIDQKIKAWQGAFDFMGLSVKFGVGEENGRKRWTFEGADIESAKAFMQHVADKFPLGNFEKEVAMIEEALARYKK